VKSPSHPCLQRNNSKPEAIYPQERILQGKPPKPGANFINNKKGKNGMISPQRHKSMRSVAEN